MFILRTDAGFYRTHNEVIIRQSSGFDALEIVIYTLFSSRCRDLYVRRLLTERLCLKVLASAVLAVTCKDTEVCRPWCRDGRIVIEIRDMQKKFVIVGLALLAVGSVVLAWVLMERRKAQEQTSQYVSQRKEEVDELLRKYDEWAQLAPDERSLLSTVHGANSIFYDEVPAAEASGGYMMRGGIQSLALAASSVSIFTGEYATAEPSGICTCPTRFTIGSVIVPISYCSTPSGIVISNS